MFYGNLLEEKVKGKKIERKKKKEKKINKK